MKGHSCNPAKTGTLNPAPQNSNSGPQALDASKSSQRQGLGPRLLPKSLDVEGDVLEPTSKDLRQSLGFIGFRGFIRRVPKKRSRFRGRFLVVLNR